MKYYLDFPRVLLTKTDDNTQVVHQVVETNLSYDISNFVNIFPNLKTGYITN